MRGNRIVVTPDRGYDVEGYLASGETVYPGMIVQIDPTQSLVGGRHAWKIYSRDADGDRPKGPFIVLKEDIGQGKAAAGVASSNSNSLGDAYATSSGTRLFGFIPLPGCELNLIFKNVSGTADDVTAGDLMIVDTGTGKVIVTTGSPETEPAMALEAITDPTEDKLLWCVWTGQ